MNIQKHYELEVQNKSIIHNEQNSYKMNKVLYFQYWIMGQFVIYKPN